MPERRIAVVTARVSPVEFADWRAKAAAAGVPLSALIRQAMARTRTWTRTRGRCRARAHPAGLAHRQQPEPDRSLGKHPQGSSRGRRGLRPPRRHRAGAHGARPLRESGARCTLNSSRTGPADGVVGVATAPAPVPPASGTDSARPSAGVEPLPNPAQHASSAPALGVSAHARLCG